MARAKQHTTTKDPVFAASEKRRIAMMEYYEALKPVARNNGEPDPKKRKSTATGKLGP